MASSYAGVSFSVETKGTWRPLWQPSPVINTRHYPHSNRNDRQFGGLGMETMQVRAELDDEADYNTLVAAIGNTARTLVVAGNTYTNVYLDNVEQGQSPANDEAWCDLLFSRSAA